MNPIKVNFKVGAFPKMLADLSHSNQFLKMFAVGSLAVAFGLLLLAFLLISRPPVVIALTPKAAVLQAVELPKPDLEIREAVQAYIERRYNWDKDSIDKNLKAAKAFVSSRVAQNFTQGVSNVRKFSKEKNVSQRAYPTDVVVDLKRSLVSIKGDRITEIQGIRAAGPLNLELMFESGSRTTENPWGIYVVKETER